LYRSPPLGPDGEEKGKNLFGQEGKKGPAPSFTRNPKRTKEKKRRVSIRSRPEEKKEGSRISLCGKQEEGEKRRGPLSPRPVGKRRRRRKRDFFSPQGDPPNQKRWKRSFPERYVEKGEKKKGGGPHPLFGGEGPKKKKRSGPLPIRQNKKIVCMRLKKIDE